MNEKRDCIHYSEVKDMNATVPCCNFYEFGKTPCKDCKRYYSKSDLVAVVRCKDCIYGIENGELCGQKVYLCSAMTNPNEFYGDFYCADGEREETE